MKKPRPVSLAVTTNLSAAALLVCLSGAAMAQSVWSGSSGNWSSTSSPGWTSGGVPDGVGAVASFSSGLTGITTLDITPGVTLGTLDFSAGNIQRSITLGSNAITMNQDGGGSGFATISNSNADTGSGNRLTISNGLITLADDLLITNTGGSTNTSGAITYSGTLGGSGNLTISNVSNTLGVGQIALTGISTFTGNVLIQKGALTISQDRGLGNIANAVTLGSSGNSASFVTAGSATNFGNNITVAATTGTNLIGSTSVAASNSTFSGTITLNGDLQVTSSKPSGNDLRFTGIIAGTGALTKVGTGAVTLAGSNTFSGDTRIVAGSLQLGTTGASSVALQNSTLDLNAVDAGSLVFGSSTATTITSATLGGLKGSRNLILANMNTTTAAVALSVGNNNASNTYSGALSGAGSFIKIGTGTQTLSGANTHTGGTTVSAGTLLINGSNAGSAVTVNSAGSVLGGTGSIAVGASHALTVNTGAILAPGTNGAAGTLTVSLNSTGDSAIFASGGKFAFDLAAPGTSDVLSFTGLTLNAADVTFNNNVVDFTDLGGLAVGSYTLFTFDQAGAYSGTLSIGAGLDAFAGSSFTYNSNSIVLNVAAVPEPTATALVGLGFAGMLYLRSRRIS